jgi:hypothetical protein
MHTRATEIEPMQFMVIGMFGRYADAEAAALDLESAGTVGEQVETISEKLYYMQSESGPARRAR